MWMCSSEYRKIHKKNFNKAIRRINKMLMEDELWNKRFSVRQAESQWVPLEPGCHDFNYYVTLEFQDKVTGMTRQTPWIKADFITGRSEVYDELNDFIVKDVRFWDNYKQEG